MDAERLAKALLERISPILPDSVGLMRQGSVLTLFTGTQSVPARLGFHDAPGLAASTLDLDVFLHHTADDLAGACRYVLDNVQDFVAEEITEIWPVPPNERWSDFPEPYAEISGDELRFGYGLPEGPVLAFPTIPLDGE